MPNVDNQEIQTAIQTDYWFCADL